MINKALHEIVTETGIDISAVERYLSQRFKMDRDYLATAKATEIMPFEDIMKQEYDLIHAGILLSAIRESLR